jgi:hypothetical protein
MASEIPTNMRNLFFFKEIWEFFPVRWLSANYHIEFSHIVCCVKIIIQKNVLYYLKEPFRPNTGLPEYVEITWLIIPKAGTIKIYTSNRVKFFS